MLRRVVITLCGPYLLAVIFVDRSPPLEASRAWGAAELSALHSPRLLVWCCLKRTSAGVRSRRQDKALRRAGVHTEKYLPLYGFFLHMRSTSTLISQV